MSNTGGLLPRPTALVVEDAPEFAEICRRILEAEGYLVHLAGNGANAIEDVRRLHPELVLLDISLPGVDGIEVCRRLREFSDAYVIMLTGLTEEVDRLLAFGAGADDYVTKPFSARELAMRIKAMKRRPREANPPDITFFDDLAVNAAAREASRAGVTLKLTKIEFDILLLLSGSPGRTFSRQAILAQVWGGDWFGDDHMIDVHLANLRRKLGESAGAPGHLRTVRGVGYRFDR